MCCKWGSARLSYPCEDVYDALAQPPPADVTHKVEVVWLDLQFMITGHQVVHN